jgi:mRNA interferase RelE/StbE
LGSNAPAWRLTFTAPARRDLRRLDPPIAKRVLAALDKAAADPDRAQLRQLVGRPEQRLRVGDWRVRLKVDRANREIIVYRVLPRGRAYD